VSEPVAGLSPQIRILPGGERRLLADIGAVDPTSLASAQKRGAYTGLKRAVEKEGLTLAHSIGVGDTESDIPFLELVAQPICFNPNMNLYRYAKRMKWKVVVERKDVVYEL